MITLCEHKRKEMHLCGCISFVCYGYCHFGCGTLFHFPSFAGEHKFAQ